MATSTTQRKIGIYLSPIRRGAVKMTVEMTEFKV